MMQVFDTGISSAEENMRFDTSLLESLDPSGDPILHLYGWEKPSATYGYFIQPENHLHLHKTEGRLDLARRPTGGGIVFHIWDLAFSFLLPANHPHFSISTLGNYQFVNQIVLHTVEHYFSLSPELTEKNAPLLGKDCQHFCMAKPTQYDVVYQGKKIAGSAQRRRKHGYLHQGTISLCPPDLSLLEELLVFKEEVLKGMQAYSFHFTSKSSLVKVRQDLQKLLASKFRNALESPPS